MSPSQKERQVDSQLPTTRTHLISKREAFNDLPDEILSYIFNIYVARLPGWLNTVAEKTRTRASPLLVAQVCYRWRQVAIATPSLWTFLAFSDKSLCEFPIERLWLKRSKACLLDVQIDEDYQNKEFIDGVFDILLPHFHRVRAFSILFFDRPAVQMFLDRFPTVAPVLCNFRLVQRKDGRGEYPWRDRQKPLLVDGAPLLKHATFTSLSGVWDTFPFANLESLYLTSAPCTWEQFANFSKAIPHLRTLKMHISGPEESDEQPPETWPQDIITFRVTTFHFCEIDEEVIAETLKRVAFPNIKDVAIICGIDIRTSAILDVLCEKQPFVAADRLHIEGFSFPDGILTDTMILKSFGFPNITRLFIRDSFSIFSALVEGRLPCFPKLGRLVTYKSRGLNIRSIVEARGAHRISPLSYVRIRRALPTPKRDRDWLKKNIKDVKIRFEADEEYENDYDDYVSGEEDQGYGLRVEGAHPVYQMEDSDSDGREPDGGDIGGEYTDEDDIGGSSFEGSDSEDVIETVERDGSEEDM